MGQVIIEGVVSSDVCDRGAQHTVEFTPQIGAYVRNGLIRVVGHITPEPKPAPPKRSKRAVKAQPAEPVADWPRGGLIEPLAD